MRMKPLPALRRLIPALLTLALSPAGAAVAGETVAVFLDNSGSMRELARTYRNDMSAILAVAGNTRLFFFPIGENRKGTLAPMVDGTEADEKVRNQHIAEVFGFDSIYTPLAQSLHQAEETPTFREAGRVLIVSDMEPDHQANAGRWNFDQKDIADLRETFKILRHWVEEGKHLEMVLHGWEERPMRDQETIRDEDSFEQELTAREEEIRRRGSKRDPEGHRRLVALGLIELTELAAKGIGKVAIHPLPLKIDGARNEEGFRNILCALPLDDPRHEVCTKADAKQFTVVVVLHPGLQLNAFMDRIRQGIDDKQYIGPLRQFEVSIRHTAQPEKTAEAQIHFHIAPGLRGQGYALPQVGLSVQPPNGQWIDLEEKGPERDRATPKKAADWIIKAINSRLREAVARYYPPEEVVKNIWISLADGPTIADGYKLFVRYQFGDGEQQKSRRRRTIRGGLLLPLSRELKEPRLYLRNESTAEVNGEPQDYYLAALSGSAITGPEDVKLSLGKGCLTNREFRLEHTDGKGEKARLTVFYRADTQTTAVYDDILIEGRPVSLGLLPGRYFWEAVPTDRPERLAEWGEINIPIPAGANDTSPCSGNKEAAPVPVSLKSDPLANPASWEKLGERIADPGQGELIATGQELIDNSAYILLALLHYTSARLPDASSQPDEALLRLWREVRAYLFEKGNVTTNLRRLERAMRLIRLDDGDGNLTPDADARLHALFNYFIDRSDPQMERGTAMGAALRQGYQTWITKELKDAGPAEQLLSPGLRQRLLPSQ